MEKPAALSSTVNPAAVSCHGSMDGIVSVDVTGGGTPYSYALGQMNTRHQTKQKDIDRRNKTLLRKVELSAKLKIVTKPRKEEL